MKRNTLDHDHLTSLCDVSDMVKTSQEARVLPCRYAYGKLATLLTWHLSFILS